MAVIDLTPVEQERVRRIILFRPRPAKVHRKAVILFQLSRWDDARAMALRYRLNPAAIDRVLCEFRSKGLEATIATGDPTSAHRERLGDVERRAPGPEKFRAMLERFPAPDRWLDYDDDWDL